MSALFALNTFGKRLKECSEVTKYLYDRHVRIFRLVKDCIEYHLKKGYLFYLDTLHYDHIEVFSENGKRCVAVLNLDGSLNMGKYATAIARPRNIKEYLK